MRILVIGGSGFIGSNLIKLLKKDTSIELINFDKVQSLFFPEITVIGDVRNYAEVESVCKNVDVIYNLAAEHADNVTPSTLYNDVNVGGAINIVNAAKVNRVKNILFTSTVAIYGLNKGSPNETYVPDPFNDYGYSKLEAENIFNNWHDSVNDSTLVIIRPSVVFGENNRGNVFNLINQIVLGRFLMVGDGKNYKSMCYVGNISAFLKAQLENTPGKYIYNYADKEDLSSIDIVKIVSDEMNMPTSKINLPYSIGLLGGYFFDLLSLITGKKFPVSAIRIKKFCADTTVNADSAFSTGFIPPYTLEEGLRRMVRYEFK